MAASFQTPNLLHPEAGSIGIAVLLDFTSGARVPVDLTNEVLDGKIDFIQSVYIDNAGNSAAVDLIFAGAPRSQRIRAQAYSQGWYPVSWPTGATRLVAISQAGITVECIFANYAMPYMVWGPNDGALVVPPLTNLAFDAVALGAGSTTQLVPGVAGQSTRLYRGVFSVDSPTVLRWTDGPAGAVLFSAQLTAGGSMFFQGSGVSWFATSLGNDLSLKSSAACNLFGGFGYVQN